MADRMAAIFPDFTIETSPERHLRPTSPDRARPPRRLAAGALAASRLSPNARVVVGSPCEPMPKSAQRSIARLNASSHSSDVRSASSREVVWPTHRCSGHLPAGTQRTAACSSGRSPRAGVLRHAHLLPTHRWRTSTRRRNLRTSRRAWSPSGSSSVPPTRATPGGGRGAGPPTRRAQPFRSVRIPRSATRAPATKISVAR